MIIQLSNLDFDGFQKILFVVAKQNKLDYSYRSLQLI